jgi:hypothetical protein
VQKYNIFSKCRHLFVHSQNELGEAPNLHRANYKISAILAFAAKVEADCVLYLTHIKYLKATGILAVPD